MTSLRVLSMNMCLLPPGMRNAPGDTDKLGRIAALGRALREELVDVDVILAQEVWDAAWSSRNTALVEDELRASGFVHVATSPRPAFALASNGLLVASRRWPIEASETLTFAASAGLQRVVPNGALRCALRVRDGYVDVVTAHIHAGPGDTALWNDAATSKEVQRRQLEELRGWLLGGEGRFVLGGDFNVDGLDRDPDLLPSSEMEAVLGTSVLSNASFPDTYPVGVDLVAPGFEGKHACLDHLFSDGRCENLGV